MQVIITNTHKLSDLNIIEGCKPYILDVDQLIIEHFGSYENLTLERRWIFSDLIERKITSLIKGSKNCAVIVMKKNQDIEFQNEISNIVSLYRSDIAIDLIIK